MPESATEIHTTPASRPPLIAGALAGAGSGARVRTALRTISPPSGVNLEAFERRLKRSGAPGRRRDDGEGASSRLSVDSCRLEVRRVAVSETAPTIASRRSVRARVSGMRPASIFDRSRMLLIRFRRWRPFRRTGRETPAAAR